MQKQLASYRSEEQQLWFDFFSKEIKAIGFREITPEVLKKMYRIYGLIPPQTKRAEDVRDRIGFVKEINGYAVFVYSSFNRKILRFSHTGPSIIIEDFKKQKRVLHRSFRREDKTFLSLMFLYAKYMTLEIAEQQPEKNKEWAYLKEKSQDVFCWFDKKTKKPIRDFFENAKQQEEFLIVFKNQKRRELYVKERERKGFSTFRRHMRKTFSKK